MLDWVKRNAHTLIAVAVVSGTVMTTVAANTAGLLPTSVTGWLAAGGSILVSVLGVFAGGKVALKHEVTRQLANR